MFEKILIGKIEEKLQELVCRELDIQSAAIYSRCR